MMTIAEWTRAAHNVADADELAVELEDNPVRARLYAAIFDALMAEFAHDRHEEDFCRQLLELASQVELSNPMSQSFQSNPVSDPARGTALLYALDGPAPDPARYDAAPTVVLEALAALARLRALEASSDSPATL